MQKTKSNLPPLLLAGAGLVLLSGGWLMSSFPLLIFFGLAPLMLLSEQNSAGGASILEKSELVLMVVAGSFLINALVRETSVVSALATGIVFTLVFVGQAWIRRVLGIRSGMITLIVFWLAAEYLVLYIAPRQGTFLADSLKLQPHWVRWNTHTGYLGGTLWILLVNWSLFLGWSHRPIWWVVAGIVLVGPMIYSLSLGNSPILREEMVNLYTSKVIEADVAYLAHGELIVRTAAWLSVLILLFTFVRQQTRK
jgi:hypothetical protein